MLTTEPDDRGAEFRDASRHRRQLEAFVRATEVPMLVLAVVFIPVVLVPRVTTLSAGTAAAFEAANYLIWAAFALELTVRAYLAPARLRYLRDHWFDVLIVALPFLRGLRGLWALVRLIALLMRVTHTTRVILRRHGLQYLLAVSTVMLLAAALGAAYFERAAGGPIADVATALWWAVTTVTTVGYGDAYPVTPEGRGIGVFLMLLGIGLFGVLTANVAAYFVSEADESPGAAGVTNELLLAEIRELRQQVEALQTRG